MPMQSGYAITIKAFIPADPKDLDAQAKAIAAAQAAKTGDLAPALELMTVDEIDVRPRTRRVEAQSDGGGES